MNNIPRNKDMLKNNEELVKVFSSLIGMDFKLTGKTRTDGANLRMLIFETLIKVYHLFKCL